jgi:xanthine dehydrogenase accessory factor
MDRRTEREALRLLEHHRPFVRAVVVRSTGSVPGKVGSTMIVRDDGTTVGTVGGAALEEEVKRLGVRALERCEGDLAHFDLASWRRGGLPSLCGGTVDIALEFVPARPNLLLWGGGHVSEAVARLLPAMEYDYSVVDDRPDYVGRDRFPGADRLEVVLPGKVFRTFDPTEFTHLYVFGYDASKDLEVLAEAIERFPNSIGLIASAAKREHLYARLRERGVARDALARIRSPVGLDIGAETPPEIAVSVIAEIVRERHPAALRSAKRPALESVTEADVVQRPP